MNERFPSPIRAITLDAGGTLLEPWPSVGQVYAEAAREAGFGVLSAAELDRRFAETWRQRQTQAFDYSRAAWARLVAQALGEITPHAASEELFDALWERFAEARAWRVFDDVVPALRLLRSRGMRLAVLSNWDERLGPLLERIGLADYFEFTLASIAAPAPKPDPRIFALAAERLGLPGGALLHVGDSEGEDFVGARQSGWWAALLDRRAASADSYRIRALTDLVRWLDQPPAPPESGRERGP